MKIYAFNNYLKNLKNCFIHSSKRGPILLFHIEKFLQLSFSPIIIFGLFFILCLLPIWESANAEMLLVTKNCFERSEEFSINYQCVEDIASGLELMEPGDTLWIDDGVYSEDVIVTKKGTEKHPIVISALPNTSPVIDGGFIYLSSNAEYVTVKGLEISNKENESGIRLSSESRSITIESCIIHDIGWNGIDLKGEEHTVLNNIIYATGLSPSYYKTHGIYVHSKNSIIERNTISQSNSGNGIRSEGLNNYISENIIFDNRDCGISVYADVPTKDIVIINNQVYNNKMGIGVLGGSVENTIENVQIVDNNIYENQINFVAIGESYKVTLENNEINNASYLQIYVKLNSNSDFTEMKNVCSSEGRFVFDKLLYPNYNEFSFAVNSILP